MSIIESFGIIVLGSAWGVRLLAHPLCVHVAPRLSRWSARRFERALVVLWTAGVAGVLGLLAFFFYFQYRMWELGDFTRYYLPPYQDLGYFYSSVVKRFAAPWLVSLAVSIPFIFFAKKLNERFGERFLERAEYRMLGLGIFLNVYPGFLFYIGLVFAGGILLAALYAALGKGRAPLYDLWLPAAILSLAMRPWLMAQDSLRLFLVS